MKTRQPLGTEATVYVNEMGHRFKVRFAPHQRKAAKNALITMCFKVGWVIPMTHPAFCAIDHNTWSEQ